MSGLVTDMEIEILSRGFKGLNLVNSFIYKSSPTITRNLLTAANQKIDKFVLTDLGVQMKNLCSFTLRTGVVVVAWLADIRSSQTHTSCSTLGLREKSRQSAARILTGTKQEMPKHLWSSLVDLNYPPATLGMASAMETLCGQAFGAKKYHMLGIYLQRSWIVLFCCTLLLLPVYIFATEILLLIGQAPEIAKQAGQLSIWLIPLNFCYVFLLPQQRFLQCQQRNLVNAATSAAALVLHVFISWLFMQKLRMGLVAAVLTLNFSWWVVVLGQFGYIVCGGCPLSWNGFSMEAFSDLWAFVKLSMASGVMLCLENWYYRILILMGGYLKDAKTAVDALAICQNINAWEFMLPLAFFVGTGVRVANELGAGNGKGAKFATVVSVGISTLIGISFCFLILVFHDKYGLLFTSSERVLKIVDRLSVLLGVTILLNSIQPILSGVAVGSGWQTTVAYVNIGSYYLIGVPLGVLLGWTFHFEVSGLWAGMIGGTAVQTLILAFLTYKCNWDNEAIIASERMNKYGVPQKH